MTCLPPVDLS